MSTMMSRSRFRFLLLACGLSIGGCSSVKTILDPLNMVGQRPLRIGVTSLELSPPPLLLPKRTLFQENLAFYLKQPVSLDLMTPRQIRVHLGTGRLKFAMLSAEDYSEVAEADTSRILAVPINENGETYRHGLIITSPKSPIQSLSEIKNQRFHFMPHGNILNEAALGALLESGISKDDLDKGILGLGLDTYHISSLEVAKSVVLEEKSAGVIDEADYKKWKKTGGSLLLLSPSQDEVRVIGETVRVPEGPFLVGKEIEPALAEKVSDYLLNVLPKRKLVLAPMGYQGFAGPIDAKEYEAIGAIHRKLHPAAALPEASSDEPVHPASSRP